MSDTIAGPRLPPWEVDALAWVRDVFDGLSGYNDVDGMSAEIVTGEDAVLLRFPSGGERYVYLDDHPHGEPPISHAARRAVKAERNRARTIGAHAKAELADCRTVISNARDLLARINADERLADLPDWLRDSVGAMNETLSASA
jgi:hypothetical protein